MLAMDALEGIISQLRSNDICGNAFPQPLTSIATDDMRPVNYWPQIGHERHSLPIIERRPLSILTEISGRLCQLLTKRLPIITDRDKKEKTYARKPSQTVVEKTSFTPAYQPVTSKLQFLHRDISKVGSILILWFFP